MQALLVKAEDLRIDHHRLTLHEFRPVEDVALRREGGAAGRTQLATEPDWRPERIGRAVEQQHVVGQVQMAVVVDPFGADREGSAAERGWHPRPRPFSHYVLSVPPESKPPPESSNPPP